jgi:hypothetical protein
MYRKRLAAGLLLVAVATARGQSPPPESALAGAVEKAFVAVNSGSLDETNAVSVQEAVASSLAGVDRARLDPDDAAHEVAALYRLMLSLDRKMAALFDRGKLTNDIASSKRHLLAEIRDLMETLLARAATAHAPLYESGGTPALAGDATAKTYNWSVSPGYESLDLAGLTRAKHTIVAMCMGNEVLSAVIATSFKSSPDLMFSHLELLHTLEQPAVIAGKSYPAGALVAVTVDKTGVLVRPVQAFFADQDVRFDFFALRDASHQPALDDAAEAFVRKALAARASGHPLPYDPTQGTTTPGLVGALANPTPATENDPRFTPSGYNCAQISAQIFRSAGLVLDTNMSTMLDGRGAKALFGSWGIDTSVPMVAPGDLDVTGTLVRLAEGRFVRELDDDRVRRVVLAKMFDAMETRAYALQSDPLVNAATFVAATLNKTILPGLIPAGLSRQATANFIILNSAADSFIDRLPAGATAAELSSDMDELLQADEATSQLPLRSPRATSPSTPSRTGTTYNLFSPR